MEMGLRGSRANIGQLPLEICIDLVSPAAIPHRIYCRTIPFSSCSRHSKVISNSYLSVNLAGLLRILTPRRETTDMATGCGRMDDEGVWEE